MQTSYYLCHDLTPSISLVYIHPYKDTERVDQEIQIGLSALKEAEYVSTFRGRSIPGANTIPSLFQERSDGATIAMVMACKMGTAYSALHHLNLPVGGLRGFLAHIPGCHIYHRQISPPSF